MGIKVDIFKVETEIKDNNLGKDMYGFTFIFVGHYLPSKLCRGHTSS
jgi:hypothetical protein